MSESLSPLRFVAADEYCRRARIALSGRTLQNWCDANPLLAQAIELRTPGKRLYDADTAGRFREIWMGAQRKQARQNAGKPFLLPRSDEPATR